MLKVKHVTSSPYHSEGNGAAERYIRTAQKLLRTALVGSPTSTWADLIPTLQYTMNATLNKATGTSPFLLMFGAPPTPLVPSLQQPTILKEP